MLISGPSGRQSVHPHRSRLRPVNEQECIMWNLGNLRMTPLTPLKLPMMPTRPPPPPPPPASPSPAMSSASSSSEKPSPSSCLALVFVFVPGLALAVTFCDFKSKLIEGGMNTGPFLRLGRNQLLINPTNNSNLQVLRSFHMNQL